MQESFSDVHAVCTPPDPQASVLVPQARQPISHPFQISLPTAPISLSQAEPLSDLALPPLPRDFNLATEGTMNSLLVTMQSLLQEVRGIAQRLDTLAAPQPLQGSGTEGNGGGDDGLGEFANVLDRVRRRGIERHRREVCS
jgi:hypothetical protein